MTLRHSLTFRVTILYALVFSVSTLALCGIYYWTSVRLPERQLQDRIRGEITALDRIYRAEGGDALMRSLHRRRGEQGRRAAFDAFIDPSGRTITTNLMSWPAPTADKWRTVEADLHVDGGEVDGKALMIDHQFADGYRLLVGRDSEDLVYREADVRHALETLLPIFLLLTLLSGAFMSWAIGRRITALDAAVRRVMTGHLSTRLTIRGSNDDLDRLAQTINAMLDRIEAAVEAVRHTSDSIAHEMRTPLARLRSHLERAALARPNRPDLVSNAIREAESLAQMFDTVIRITRLQTGSAHIHKKPIDLAKLARDAAELYLPLAAAKMVDLTVDDLEETIITADPDLVFQAICNLVDNAIKFTKARGRVHLTVGRGKRGSFVSIRDTGPGIPHEFHKLAVQRFFRMPSAKAVPGMGLGLSLVEVVGNAHDALLTFENLQPGLNVAMHFPACFQGVMMRGSTIDTVTPA